MVTAFRFKFTYFCLFSRYRDLLDIQRVCSMVFTQFPELVIYNILCLFVLYVGNCYKYIYVIPDGTSNVRPVQMLENNCLHSIHYWMKEICMLPIQYVTLEYCRNNSLTHTCYKSKIYITSSTKITSFVRTCCLFCH